MLRTSTLKQITGMANSKVNYWKQNYDEYLRSPQWAILRNEVKSLSCNRCVLFPWRKVQNVHHMHYKKVRGVYEGNKYIFTAGKDIPVLDLIPLSRQGHQIVHLDFFWKSHRKVTNYILRFLFILNILIGAICRILHFFSCILGLARKTKKKKVVTLSPVTTKDYKAITITR